MSEKPERDSAEINTGGGAYIGGPVDTGGGTFVGRDLITEESSYDVRGLPNPYLGLRAFTYADRDKFAGRSRSIAEAIEKITRPRSKPVLLFITGASGSGKSSFAQAGLLPALEDHYRQRKMSVQTAVFQPTSDPVAALADALSLLGLPEISPTELDNFALNEFGRFLLENLTESQVNLLLIDQFEEIFTQSSPGHRDRLFGFLLGLPSFDACQTHVLATLRSDFLDELFKYKRLWDIAVKSGVELRAMSQEDLKEAIQQPLEAACRGAAPQFKPDERYCGKRFELALLDKLALDASQEDTYLPLLQVTAREVWNQGSLKLENYSNLTDAIRNRAELVYRYADSNRSRPAEERPREDRDEIMDIFLDLVNVSLDDDQRRDVRRRRLKDELIGDSARRRRLLAELIDARLLSAATVALGEVHEETVDIIHESLIQNWDRLRDAIFERRQQLRRRSRFEQQLADWLRNDKSRDYLLYGVRLEEAHELQAGKDIALRATQARDFLKASDQAARLSRLLTLAGLMAATAVIAIVSTLALTGQLNRLIYRPLQIEWVEIPAGEFRMGSTEDEIGFALDLPNDLPPGSRYNLSNEEPAHAVYLDAYEIARYEITNKQYFQCVRAGECAPPSNTQYSDPRFQDYPVTGVNWEDARGFCEWNRARLPTEAQWEKAARAGGSQESGIFPWGNYLPDPENQFELANVGSGDSGSTTPVGSFSPGGDSYYGVSDMAGNVWEWVWDWYAGDYYRDPASGLPNPQGPVSGDTHTVKGGSFDNDWVLARSSYRSDRFRSGDTAFDLGFRCVH